jgi:hypothetical protein
VPYLRSRPAPIENQLRQDRGAGAVKAEHENTSLNELQIDGDEETLLNKLSLNVQVSRRCGQIIRRYVLRCCTNFVAIQAQQK